MEKIQNFLDFLLRKQNKSKFRYTKSKDAETQQFRSSKSVEKKNKEEAYNFSKNFTESSIPNSLVDSETFWKKIIFSQSLDSKFSTPKKKPNHILHHPIKKEKPVLIKEIPEKRNISSNSEKVELLREELILEQEEQEFCDFNQWLEKEFNSPFSNHELQVNRPLPSISTKRPRQLEISQDPPSKKTKLENNKEILKSTVPILNLMELDEELFSFSSEKVKSKFLNTVYFLSFKIF